jgi:hypothetical protein
VDSLFHRVLRFPFTAPKDGLHWLPGLSTSSAVVRCKGARKLAPARHTFKALHASRDISGQ